MEYFETSAKTGENVQEAYDAIIKKVYDKQVKEEKYRISSGTINSHVGHNVSMISVD